MVHSQIEAAGTPIRRLELPEKYRILSGNSFATHVDTIKENPDLLKRFARAYTKGMVVCEINPEGCIRSAWRKHPSIRPANADDPKVMADSVRIMLDNLRHKLPSGDPKSRRYGEFNAEAWKTNVAILAENGLLKRTDVSLDALFTNEFVPDFSIDYDKVAAFAKTLK
ncbi:MAG: ABC transporter substrate-binding protein [Xanthobacteraceae bacterium]|nr:ABC transporter substrate-binding protein [Xanthobacteraceae bacterium]